MLSPIEKIIYELLFDTNREEFIFDLTNVMEYHEDYPDITEDIVHSVNKGGIFIVNDCLIIDKETLHWNIKIKRD